MSGEEKQHDLLGLVKEIRESEEAFVAQAERIKKMYRRLERKLGVQRVSSDVRAYAEDVAGLAEEEYEEEPRKRR